MKGIGRYSSLLRILSWNKNSGNQEATQHFLSSDAKILYLYVYDMYMMAKTIAVSDDVYKKLKKARMPGESFSSTIKRSLEMKPKLSDVVGTRTLSREDWRVAQRILAKSERKTLEKLVGNA